MRWFSFIIPMKVKINLTTFTTQHKMPTILTFAKFFWQIDYNLFHWHYLPISSAPTIAPFRGTSSTLHPWRVILHAQGTSLRRR